MFEFVEVYDRALDLLKAQRPEIGDAGDFAHEPRQTTAAVRARLVGQPMLDEIAGPVAQHDRSALFERRPHDLAAGAIGHGKTADRIDDLDDAKIGIKVI